MIIVRNEWAINGSILFLFDACILLFLQLYGVILIKFARRKRMIREAKRKHGVSHRNYKNSVSDLNLASKTRKENLRIQPDIYLGTYQYLDWYFRRESYPPTTWCFIYPSKWNLSFLDSVDPEVHNLTLGDEQTSENTHRPFSRYRHETSTGGLMPPNNPYVEYDMKRPSSGR